MPKPVENEANVEAPSVAWSVVRAWQRIDDLPENWKDLCREDLRAVQRRWVEDRKLVRDEVTGSFATGLHGKAARPCGRCCRSVEDQA